MVLKTSPTQVAEKILVLVILSDPDDSRVKNHEFSVSVTITSRLFFSNYIVLIVFFLRYIFATFDILL